MTRDVVLLGSTGSIGTQAIEVVRAAPERFRVTGIAAGGSRPDVIAAQAIELGVEVVGVARSTSLEDLQLALYAEAQRRGYHRGEYLLPKLVAGPDAAAEVASWPCDLVLNGMTGSVGLGPSLAALDAGHALALANKETLVAGGPLVTSRAKPGQLVPVDSEHTAILQCLRAGAREEVERLVVTASGGPFRGRTRADLEGVTIEQAMAHPTWSMGQIITLNSATLVNKGLEVIEAHWLFDVSYDQIDVVVHPQSIVHSMVEFVDGSTIAAASPTDMRLTIAIALAWPGRVPDAVPGLDWSSATAWTFEPLDNTTFPAVELAREAGRTGGTAPAVYNAANEQCLAEFVAGRLPFVGIVDTIAAVVAEHGSGTSAGSTPGVQQPMTLADVLEAEDWARERVRAMTGGDDL